MLQVNVYNPYVLICQEVWESTVLSADKLQAAVMTVANF